MVAASRAMAVINFKSHCHKSFNFNIKTNVCFCALENSKTSADILPTLLHVCHCLNPFFHSYFFKLNEQKLKEVISCNNAVFITTLSSSSQRTLYSLRKFLVYKKHQ